MILTPREQERLLIYVAGSLAKERLARGVKLNHPEALALISSFVLEAARDGKTVEQVMVDGTKVLRADDVMEGVSALLSEVQIEATFPDGTKLVTIHDPIPSGSNENHPGQYILEDSDVVLMADAPLTEITVHNQGDRPIQVGSHYHFYETNSALIFERKAAYGKRLAIPAGTAMRFEPGDQKTVCLVDFGGERKMFGHRGLVQGDLKS